MNLWLILLVAALLVPVVRVFMADGCTSSTTTAPAHGTHPLYVYVTVSNVVPPPGTGEGDAVLTGGTVSILPPSGGGVTIPVAGPVINHPVPVTADMFSGATPPYRWAVSADLQFRATRPVPGSTAAGENDAILFDANADRTVQVWLHLESMGSTTPGGISDLAWTVSIG
jgi:hypothetical protein